MTLSGFWILDITFYSDWFKKMQNADGCEYIDIFLTGSTIQPVMYSLEIKLYLPHQGSGNIILHIPKS